MVLSYGLLVLEFISFPKTNTLNQLTRQWCMNIMANCYWQWRKCISSGLKPMPPFQYRGTSEVCKIQLIDIVQKERDHLEGCFFQPLENPRSSHCLSDFLAPDRAACFCLDFSIAFFPNHSQKTLENSSALHLSFFGPLIFTVLQNNNSIVYAKFSWYPVMMVNLMLVWVDHGYPG